MGHTSAAVLSNREGVIVDLLTHNPEKWNKEYIVNLPDGERITGKLNMISLPTRFSSRKRIITNKTLFAIRNNSRFGCREYRILYLLSQAFKRK